MAGQLFARALPALMEFTSPRAWAFGLIGIHEYVRRLRDLKYHETVFELLAKQFEVAKLDEAREGSIIQVVDSAVAPDKRSSPHRLLIVVSVTILAFFLAGFWIVLRQRWALASHLPENRHKLQAIRDGWKGAPDRA